MNDFLKKLGADACLLAGEMSRKVYAWVKRNPKRAVLTIVTVVCARHAMTPHGKEHFEWLVSLLIDILIGN
jgi:hypothetical protein